MAVALLAHIDVHQVAPIFQPLFDPGFDPSLHADQKLTLHLSTPIQHGGQERRIAMKPIGQQQAPCGKLSQQAARQTRFRLLIPPDGRRQWIVQS